MFYSSSIDCIWNGFTITEDRKDSYTWPNPYFNNKQIFVVRTDPNIDNIHDLTGKTVEVQLDQVLRIILQKITETQQINLRH